MANVQIEDKYLEMTVKIIAAIAAGPAAQHLLTNEASVSQLVRSVGLEIRALHHGVPEPAAKE